MKQALLKGLATFFIVIAFLGEAHSAHDITSARDNILIMAKNVLDHQHDSQIFRFHVSARWIPGSLDRLSADHIIEVKMDGPIERFTNFVVVYDHNGRKQEANVQLQVDIERLIPVARERVVSGTVLDEDHLMMQWIELHRDRGQVATEKKDVIGNTVRRTLLQGEPVRIADLTSDYIIKAGESVTLSFTRNGMRVDVGAVSRQDGSLNEEIRVYSNETRRTYLAIVEEPGIVVWKRTL